MFSVKMSIYVVSALCSYFLVVSGFGASEQLDYQTFQPPFAEVDASGERLASRHWKSSGETVVNNNFIRLTPDRQSKRGALWSRKSIGYDSFSSILKFRISGQGKNFFGDGIGFWITQQEHFTEGTIHGSEEMFLGIGIIFDTYKNTENIAAHRDVTVLINDGTKTYELMTKEVQGCNTNFRYHADRADFSVTDATRAKVTLNLKSLEILIDAKNTGEWVSCFKTDDTGLHSGWARNSHMGLTATTGGLADNHDIISLKTYSDHETAATAESTEANKKHFSLDYRETIDFNVNSISETLNGLLKRYDTLDHHVEHEFASAADNIKNLIGKLEKREDKSDGRLENLEGQIKQAVELSLEKRLTAMEHKMRVIVDGQMNSIESSLDKKMSSLEDKTATIANQTDASWRLPFLFILILLIGAGVGIYMFYCQLLKRHLL